MLIKELYDCTRLLLLLYWFQWPAYIESGMGTGRIFFFGEREEIADLRLSRLIIQVRVFSTDGVRVFMIEE